VVNALKTAGIGALSVAITLAALALPVLFINGGLWAAERLLPLLVWIGWIVVALDLLALLASIIPHVRPVTGTGLLLSSYLFGAILWLFALVLTYHLWGLFAVVVGLFIMGIGVVPIAMLATLFKGAWEQLVILLALTALTFGTRLAGIAVAARTSDPVPQTLSSDGEPS
jgi:hypothetical protein